MKTPATGLTTLHRIRSLIANSFTSDDLSQAKIVSENADMCSPQSFTFRGTKQIIHDSLSFSMALNVSDWSYLEVFFLQNRCNEDRLHNSSVIDLDDDLLKLQWWKLRQGHQDDLLS